MNYEFEVAKLLSDSADLRKDYPRICDVARAVARNDADFMPYVWAYMTGKSDWRKMENQLF